MRQTSRRSPLRWKRCASNCREQKRVNNQLKLRLAEKPHGVVVQQLFLLRLGKILPFKDFQRRIFPAFAVGEVRGKQDLILAEQLEKVMQYLSSASAAIKILP